MLEYGSFVGTEPTPSQWTLYSRRPVTLWYVCLLMTRALDLGGVEGTGVVAVSVHIALYIKAISDVEGVDSDVEGPAKAGLAVRRLCCIVMKVAASILFSKRGTQSLRASVKKVAWIDSIFSDSRRKESSRSSSTCAGRLSSRIARRSNVRSAVRYMSFAIVMRW
jgi:hypothetical protein